VIRLTQPKVWLITGTSTGFGRQLVEALRATDARIVATARNIEKIADWTGEKNMLTLQLDVTNQAQIDAAIQATKTEFGRIDVLVNNAGWGYFGSVEEGEIDVARQLMETNFWGLANMTRAVLQPCGHKNQGKSLTCPPLLA
jgi:NADP-dependent 3-hydroxy acid dehydrogenase YdfG